MNNKKVSIIIPMYNAELYVEKMIESVLSQTYVFWELIIIDDNSTDNSCNIVSKYVRQYDNIILYVKDKNDKKGANSSRNIGFQIASGEYVVFFDADDLVTNYCIHQRVAFMEENPEIDFAVFPAITFANIAFDCTPIFGYKQEYAVMAHFLSSLLPFAVWTNIYRKSSLISHNIIWSEDLPCLQDTDYNVISLINGLKYKMANSAPDYLWRFIGNVNSISKTINTDKRLDVRINFLNKLSLLNLGHYYEGALLLRSFYIYLSVIKSNTLNICTQFLDAQIFKSHNILSFKLRLHYRFIKKLKISNRFLILTTLFICSPIYTFRGMFFNQLRKVRQYLLYLNLRREYKQLIDASVSY